MESERGDPWPNLTFPSLTLGSGRLLQLTHQPILLFPTLTFPTSPSAFPCALRACVGQRAQGMGGGGRGVGRVPLAHRSLQAGVIPAITPNGPWGSLCSPHNNPQLPTPTPYSLALSLHPPIHPSLHSGWWERKVPERLWSWSEMSEANERMVGTCSS